MNDLKAALLAEMRERQERLAEGQAEVLCLEAVVQILNPVWEDHPGLTVEEAAAKLGLTIEELEDRAKELALTAVDNMDVEEAGHE